MTNSLPTHGYGEQRALTPAATVARMRPYFAQLGITRLANVTGLDIIGIPTVMVTRPNSRALSVHQGKGPDLASAQASGIMEAVEHHSAEHCQLVRLAASVREARSSDGFLDVSSVPRSVLPLTEDSVVDWVWGRRLAPEAGEAVLVPHELVHLDLRLPLPARSGYFPLGTNGLASGNRWDEAVVHGLCELIERDALALFYQAPVARQMACRMDLGSVDEPWLRELLARYEAAEVEVAVWDITTDIGIPSFFCMIADRELEPFRPLGSARGSGTHPDRAVALARALCEAAQSRLTQIVGARDDLQALDLAQLRSHEAQARTLAQLRSGPAGRRYSAVTTLRSESVAADLTQLVTRLLSCGLKEIITVDLTPPGLPCAVARVIVPGLESVFNSPSYRPGVRARRALVDDAGAGL